jgi:thiol-disulfide isomerase/thioredoxin
MNLGSSDKKYFIIGISLSLVTLISIMLIPYLNIYNVEVQVSEGEVGVFEGYIAQDIEFKDLSGNMRRLSEFSGKVILLEFSATWCTACKYQLYILKTLYSSYRGRVIFITVDIDASLEVLNIYAEENGIEWLVASGKEAGYIYNVRALPTIVIIDKDGVIRYRFDRAVNLDDLSYALDSLL